MWQICCYPNVYIYIFLSELIVSALSLGSMVAFFLVFHHQHQLEMQKIVSIQFNRQKMVTSQTSITFWETLLVTLLH